MVVNSYTPSDDLPRVECGDRLELLFYCIGNAVHWGRNPLDDFIIGIIDPAFGGYCGGDPGWEIDGLGEDGNELVDQYGAPALRCWALQEISGIEPCEIMYSKKEVIEWVKVAVTNIATKYPERAQEASDVLERCNKVLAGLEVGGKNI